jgi:hypothetical protein
MRLPFSDRNSRPSGATWKVLMCARRSSTSSGGMGTFRTGLQARGLGRSLVPIQGHPDLLLANPLARWIPRRRVVPVTRARVTRRLPLCSPVAGRSPA